jgi:hypothetical protein
MLAGILARPKYLATAMAGAAVFGVLLSVSSGIVVPVIWDISPLADPFRIAMAGITAVLFGLNVGVLAHNYDQRTEASGSTSMTLLGAFAAFMTSSCLVCQPFILFSLGLGGIGALMAGLSLIIGLFSIAMLAISLRGGLETSSGACGVGRGNDMRRV